MLLYFFFKKFGKVKIVLVIFFLVLTFPFSCERFWVIQSFMDS